MDFNKTISDRVLEQIKKDVLNGDMTAIEELISNVERYFLIDYLPEEQWNELKIGSTLIVDRPDDKIEYSIEDGDGEIVDYSDDYNSISEKFNMLRLENKKVLTFIVLLVETHNDGSVTVTDSQVMLTFS